MTAPSRIEQTTERLWRDRETPNFASHNLQTAFELAKRLLDGLVPQGIAHAKYTPVDEIPDFSDVSVGCKALEDFIPVVEETLAEAVSVYSSDHDRVGLDELDKLWCAVRDMRLLVSRPFSAPDNPLNLRIGHPPISHRYAQLGSLLCPIDDSPLQLYRRIFERMPEPFNVKTSPVPPSYYFLEKLWDYTVRCADCYANYAHVSTGELGGARNDILPHEILPISEEDLHANAEKHLHYLCREGTKGSLGFIQSWLAYKLKKDQIPLEEAAAERTRILSNAAARGFEVPAEYL